MTKCEDSGGLYDLIRQKNGRTCINGPEVSDELRVERKSFTKPARTSRGHGEHVGASITSCSSGA